MSVLDPEGVVGLFTVNREKYGRASVLNANGLTSALIEGTARRKTLAL